MSATTTKMFLLHFLCSFSNVQIKALSLADPLKTLEHNGYPGEIHEVTTEDGYILKVVRIVQEKFDQRNPPVVLLNHGLLATSGYFMDFKKSLSIAYILSDAGYDVWMMNARGNGYSTKHTSLDLNNNPQEFYNFTFHEVGYYDIPATIDYILNVTKEPNLHYIGHSQGGTAYYVTASYRPEYNKKVKLAFMLGATASFKNSPVSHITFLSRHTEKMKNLAIYLGMHRIPLMASLRGLFNFLCSYSIMESFCYEIVWFIAGFANKAQFDSERFQTAFNVFPSDCSTKQFYHYSQLVEQKRFGPYDYGLEGNRKEYGSDVPPDYDFSKVTTPIALFCSTNDQLFSLKDCELTSTFLPNLAFKKVIKRENFNHLDYVTAKDAKKLVFNDMLTLMKKYN